MIAVGISVLLQPTRFGVFLRRALLYQATGLMSAADVEVMQKHILIRTDCTGFGIGRGLRRLIRIP